MSVLTVLGDLVAAPSTPSPTPTAAATTAAVVPSGGGAWQIPKIVPDFSGPGIAGMTSLGDWMAGIALVSAGIVIILGAMIAALGPRMGFMHAKALGMGGILGGLSVGALVALATPAVGIVGGWFTA